MQNVGNLLSIQVYTEWGQSTYIRFNYMQKVENLLSIHKYMQKVENLLSIHKYMQNVENLLSIQVYSECGQSTFDSQDMFLNVNLISCPAYLL